ncbi:hypothetical protein QTP88_012047 [Uroleucon formosanum]
MLATRESQDRVTSTMDPTPLVKVGVEPEFAMTSPRDSISSPSSSPLLLSTQSPHAVDLALRSSGSLIRATSTLSSTMNCATRSCATRQWLRLHCMKSSPITPLYLLLQAPHNLRMRAAAAAAVAFASVGHSPSPGGRPSCICDSGGAWPRSGTQQPVLPQPTITNVEDSSSGEKDYVLNNGPLLINPNNSTAVISTNVDENGNNDFEVQPDTNKKSLDIVFSFLIDKCQYFPSDPYLFKNITLSKALIRALIEVGPCQPGIEKKLKFPKNEKGNCFNPDWYDIKSRSGFHFKRNWLVFSPKSNKMYCFSCFLFRTLSKHNSNWSDPAEGVNNFRKGLEKIIKHETSSDHTNTVKEYLVLKARLQNDNTIIHNLMRAEKSEKEHNRNVLKRLIDVSLFLAKNGLPFRGHKEKLNDGKSNNGLFLELVKLIAKIQNRGAQAGAANGGGYKEAGARGNAARMAGNLGTHGEGGVDEEGDSRHQEVGVSAKSGSHYFPHGLGFDGSWMLPALPVEEEEGR